jgi:hypothetical protein
MVLYMVRDLEQYQIESKLWSEFDLHNVSIILILLVFIPIKYKHTKYIRNISYNEELFMLDKLWNKVKNNNDSYIFILIVFVVLSQNRNHQLSY